MSSAERFDLEVPRNGDRAGRGLWIKPWFGVTGECGRERKHVWGSPKARMFRQHLVGGTGSGGAGRSWEGVLGKPAGVERPGPPGFEHPMDPPTRSLVLVCQTALE